MYSVLSVRLSLCLCVCNAVCVCVCGKQERERVWVRKSARVLEEEEMSDASGDDEAMCPLCTEEMDVTDRSINFCKCGYQLCLWCWHTRCDIGEPIVPSHLGGRQLGGRQQRDAHPSHHRGT